MEEDLQREQSLEEEGKVSDPVKHKHSLDGDSQETQSGFLMDEKWTEKNQWCGKLLLTSFKWLQGEEAEDELELGIY